MKHYPFYLIDNDLKKILMLKFYFTAICFITDVQPVKQEQAKGLWGENQKVELTAHTEGSK